LFGLGASGVAVEIMNGLHGGRMVDESRRGVDAGEDFRRGQGVPGRLRACARWVARLSPVR
jgi:hypothetical protein